MDEFWGVFKFKRLVQRRNVPAMVELVELASLKVFTMSILKYSIFKHKYDIENGIMGQWEIKDGLTLLKEEKNIEEFLQKARHISNPLHAYF